MEINSKYQVVIIGAGQAGLSTSYFLQKKNIDHIVLEQYIIGSSWQNQRWDSFKMNTPNWMSALPGMEIADKAGDFFMTKTEFITYLRNYVERFQLPVSEHSKATQVSKENGVFSIVLACGQKIVAQAVVIAAGAMTHGSTPELHKKAARHLAQIHAADYKNPQELPAGNVLIVGAGQSGCQIAEELAVNSRKVYLASSKVPRARRRYKGKDIMKWMDIMGTMDTPTEDLAQNPTLNMTQPQTSGLGTLGHTVSYQSLSAQGVTVLGSLKDIENSTFYFHDNAIENVKYADQSSEILKQKIDDFIITTQLQDLPAIQPDPADRSDEACLSASRLTVVDVEKHNITSIIWATGFGYDFSFMDASWLDAAGKPLHQAGKIADGLYCVGFPWLRKKKSGLIYGVKEDAEFLTRQLLSWLATINLS